VNPAHPPACPGVGQAHYLDVLCTPAGLYTWQSSNLAVLFPTGFKPLCIYGHIPLQPFISNVHLNCSCSNRPCNLSSQMFISTVHAQTDLATFHLKCSSQLFSLKHTLQPFISNVHLKCSSSNIPCNLSSQMFISTVHPQTDLAPFHLNCSSQMFILKHALQPFISNVHLKTQPFTSRVYKKYCALDPYKCSANVRTSVNAPRETSGASQQVTLHQWFGLGPGDAKGYSEPLHCTGNNR
jgi:hypothetical protein